MELRDAGTHRAAAVNDFGQLLTEATTSPEDRHINIHHARVWSLPFEVDPAGAGDYFFYLKNTDSIDYLVTDLRGSTTVVGYIEVNHVSGTPAYVGETPVVPVNRHLGSSNAPDCTINIDTDITGLTNEGTLFRIDVATINQLAHLRSTAGIVLPTGQALALSWSAATGILHGNLSLVALV